MSNNTGKLIIIAEPRDTAGEAISSLLNSYILFQLIA